MTPHPILCHTRHVRGRSSRNWTDLSQKLTSTGKSIFIVFDYVRGAGQTTSNETMTIQYHSRARYVIGPDGRVLTVADLPPRNTKRWVIRRKAELVAAVRGGLLTLEEACERYTLTVDEFLSWQRTLDRHGLPGLRATRVQDYRE
jgi:Protein of unknown function (DUF1153)